MRVLHLSEHSELVNHHLLVSSDILLENYFNRNLRVIMACGLSNNAISTGTKSPPKFVFGPVSVVSADQLWVVVGLLFIVRLRLTLDFV